MRSHASCLFDIGQSLLVDFGLCAHTRLVFLTLVSLHPHLLPSVHTATSILTYTFTSVCLYIHFRRLTSSRAVSAPHSHLRPLVLSFITVRLYVQPSSAVNSPRPLASSFIAGHCTSTHIRPSPLAYIFTTVRIHLLQPPSAVDSHPAASIFVYFPVYSPPSTSIVNHYWSVHRHQHPSIVPSVITVHVSLHSPRPYIYPAPTLIAVHLPLQEGHSPEKCPKIFKLK